eukprot:15343527-Ditylum_brightwellii.AAC.1
MSSRVPDVSCPRPVPSGEHHGDGTCPGRVPDMSRTCPGHVLMSVLLADFWTWDARTFPTKMSGT